MSPDKKKTMVLCLEEGEPKTTKKHVLIFVELLQLTVKSMIHR